MRFIYAGSHIPAPSSLLININEAAERLYLKLEMLNVARVELSDANRHVLFQEHMSNLQSSLQQCSYVIALALAPIKLPLERVVFIDYGGGIGMLSLLAKELGVGHVIHNDIDPTATRDAQALGTALHRKADYYITGEMKHVIECLDTNGLEANVLTSIDVIEHIYNLEEFMIQVGSLDVSIALASHANQYNPWIRRKIQALHHEHEFEDRINQWGHYKRYGLKSFFKVREGIIRHQAPELSPDIVQRLTKATRGMNRDDVVACVEDYQQTQLLPTTLHSTDTCDPETGNWSERLIDPHYLQALLPKFQVHIRAGYHGYDTNRLQNCINIGLNYGIRATPAAIGLKAAPFYVVTGSRNKSS